jgi:hypothetical protein
MIDAGHGAVVIDPKGDELLAFELERAARRAWRAFRLWSPEGAGVYNPFAHGTGTKRADKILAGKTYSEPHYLRQAKRYLGHAVRVLRNGWPVTVATLTDAMVPDKLEWLGRALRDERAKQAPRLRRRPDRRATPRTRGLQGPAGRRAPVLCRRRTQRRCSRRDRVCVSVAGFRNRGAARSPRGDSAPVRIGVYPTAGPHGGRKPAICAMRMLWCGLGAAP